VSKKKRLRKKIQARKPRPNPRRKPRPRPRPILKRKKLKKLKAPSTKKLKFRRSKRVAPKKLKFKRPKKPAPKKPVAPPKGIEEHEWRVLKRLPKDIRDAAVSAVQKKHGKEPKKKKEKPSKLAFKKEKVQTARDELVRAVRIAGKKGGRLYGAVSEETGKRHKVRGRWSGFRVVPFEKRAAYIQENLKREQTEWRRDLYVQAVHIREYLAQGDGGDGRRATLEKTQRAGYRCIDEHIKKRRVYQIYISTIRVLLRKSDAQTYGGYATTPIDNKRAKAATDIRGLEGFETVDEGENPKAALDRLLERLDNHLDEILDGLPVIYVKSLEIKFDVEAK
jgi:hypothetical protein